MFTFNKYIFLIFSVMYNYGCFPPSEYAFFALHVRINLSTQHRSRSAGLSRILSNEGSMKAPGSAKDCIVP